MSLFKSRAGEALEHPVGGQLLGAGLSSYDLASFGLLVLHSSTKRLNPKRLCYDLIRELTQVSFRSIFFTH